jgi:hypothetical protein
MGSASVLAQPLSAYADRMPINLIHKLAWWRYERLDLVSPLAPEQCLARLRDQTGRESVSRGDKPAIVSFSHTTFRLRKRRSLKFQTVLYGRVVDENGGSRIECRIGLERAAVLLAHVWTLFAGAALVFLFLCANLGSEPGQMIRDLPMMVFGWATLPLGIFVVRTLCDDSAFLKQTLRDVLKDGHG